MIKTYFYHDGFREFGPFTAQELLAKKIRPDYKLRLDGQEKWVLAKEVEEVAALFKAQQAQPNVSSSSTGNTVNPNRFQPQGLKSDLNYEEHSFSSQKTTYSNASNAPVTWQQKVLLAVLLFWLFDIFVGWIMGVAGLEMWGGPGRIISIFLRMLFSFIPILIAVCIKNNTLRIIAIIVAVLITLSSLINNARWIFNF